MNALRNQAQLIGYVGNDPEITELQGGKKLAKFSLATNEIYNNTEVNEWFRQSGIPLLRGIVKQKLQKSLFKKVRR
jgi:hypothetical protein